MRESFDLQADAREEMLLTGGVTFAAISQKSLCDFAEKPLRVIDKTAVNEYNRTIK